MRCVMSSCTNKRKYDVYRPQVRSRSRSGPWQLQSRMEWPGTCFVSRPKGPKRRITDLPTTFYILHPPIIFYLLLPSQHVWIRDVYVWNDAIVIVISRFLERPQKRSRRNQLMDCIMYVLCTFCDLADVWRSPTSYGVHTLPFLGARKGRRRAKILVDHSPNSAAFYSTDGAADTGL